MSYNNFYLLTSSSCTIQFLERLTQYKGTSLQLAFLKYPLPFINSISKIIALSSPSPLITSTIASFEEIKRKACVWKMQSLWCFQCFDISCKVSQALQEHSVYYLADPPILWEDIWKGLPGWNLSFLDNRAGGFHTHYYQRRYSWMQFQCIGRWSFPLISYHLPQPFSEFSAEWEDASEYKSIYQLVPQTIQHTHDKVVLTMRSWNVLQESCSLCISNNQNNRAFHFTSMKLPLRQRVWQNQPAEYTAATFWRIALRTTW